MDMVIEMNKMPLKGETILGKTLTYIPGGKGANQAFAAGMLGGNAIMLGCVGCDDIGEQLKKNMRKSGTSIEGIASISAEASGLAIIYVDDHGDNSIVVIPGSNSACDVSYLQQNDEWFQKCSYVIFQMEIPHEAVYYGIRRAKELGKTVILNPAPAPDEIPADILAKVDYLTPNETEIVKLTKQTDLSMDSIRTGAQELLRMGVKNVLITLGDKGALLINKNGEKLYPAKKVNAVDTTAAGDCFNGALVVGLAEGMDQEEAIRFANTASSIAVTRKGAQSSIPTREEVMKQM